MSILLGVTGAIGSGKSTFATFLAEAEPSHAIYETWHVVGEIATAFNQALKAELEFEISKNDLELANQALIWLPEAISDQLHFNLVWNQLAITKRDNLENPALYKKLWVYLRAARENPKILDTIITAENKETYRPILQWIGGYLVAKASKTIWYSEILRRIDLHEKGTNLIIINGVRYPSDAEIVRKHGGKIVQITRGDNEGDKTDPTEATRDEIKPDITVVNNGTLGQFEKIAIDLINDLATGNTEKFYFSTR